MAKIDIYNQETGEVVKKMDLNPKIFGVKPKEELVHQVLVILQANRRKVVAHTKTRSEVRGGGRKPWRQKGTGRARHGSIRSPLWVGGGVTFGPRKDRVYKKDINKKMKKKALFMVLTDKAESKNIVAIEDLKFEKIKTKQARAIIDKLPLMNRKTLVLAPSKDENILMSFRNIPKVEVMRANDINVLDLLNFEKLIIPVKSFEIIEKTFLMAD